MAASDDYCRTFRLIACLVSSGLQLIINKGPPPYLEFVLPRPLKTLEYLVYKGVLAIYFT